MTAVKSVLFNGILCNLTCQSTHRPVIPKELKQLLSDPQAAAALQPSAALGTCDVLSPVRPKKQLQHALGAGEQVSLVSSIAVVGCA
jgi:hypothetical protein